MVKVYYVTDSLAHAGKKGMKWGYNHKKRNGKRTAGEATKFAFKDEDGKLYRKQSDDKNDYADRGYEYYETSDGRNELYVRYGKEWADELWTSTISIGGSTTAPTVSGRPETKVYNSDYETRWLTKGKRTQLIEAGKKFVNNIIDSLIDKLEDLRV